MTITISSTTKVVHLNGVPTRVWEGQTDTGIPMHAYIARVGVSGDQDATQFEAELVECRMPTAAVEAIPLRLIL